MTNEIAPKGAIFVCTHCGKRSYDLYGDQKISRTWDVSCVLNAVLCDEKSLVMKGELVTSADPWEESPFEDETESPPGENRDSTPSIGA